MPLSAADIFEAWIEIVACRRNSIHYILIRDLLGNIPWIPSESVL